MTAKPLVVHEGIAMSRILEVSRQLFGKRQIEAKTNHFSILPLVVKLDWIKIKWKFVLKKFPRWLQVLSPACQWHSMRLRPSPTYPANTDTRDSITVTLHPICQSSETARPSELSVDTGTEGSCCSSFSSYLSSSSSSYFSSWSAR